MAEGKIKMSDTLRFLSQKLNAITPQGSVRVQIEVTETEVHAASELLAKVLIQNDAEFAQNTSLPPNHELVIPVRLHIPEDAVLSEDGAKWGVEIRVVLNRSLDPRDRVSFEVLKPLEYLQVEEVSSEE